MKFKWWGHASFLISTAEGFKIITDPYNEDLPYARIDDTADIVTVSHDHFDHNAVELLSGDPRVVNKVDGFSDENVEIKGISSFHDDAQGAERGDNIIFVIELEGKKICHLGDLGHPLSQEQQNQLKDVDILLIPVGGHFTIDAEQGRDIVEQLEPAVVIPMHYKTDILNFPIAGVDKFMELFPAEKVKEFQGPEVEITKLPSTLQIYGLDYVK